MENTNQEKGVKKQATVLVMAESKTVAPSKKYKHKPNKKAGYIKMQLLKNLRKETTNKQVEKAVNKQSSAITDGANNYNDLKENLTEHKAVIAQVKKEASKILPWVHIAISNAKRLLLDIHHFIGNEYLQSYLNEYCYKFNGNISIRYSIGLYSPLCLINGKEMCKLSDSHISF